MSNILEGKAYDYTITLHTLSQSVQANMCKCCKYSELNILFVITYPVANNYKYYVITIKRISEIINRFLQSVKTATKVVPVIAYNIITIVNLHTSTTHTHMHTHTHSQNTR